MKRTNAQTVYSRLAHVTAEYDEMVAMLTQVQRLTQAHVDGAQVDWAAVGASILKLQAFQPEEP